MAQVPNFETSPTEINYPDSPHEKPGFEIAATDTDDGLSFTPDYYPDRFVQNKNKELDRNGRQCRGESVAIDAIKNREFHATGIVLEYEIPTFQRLMDYQGNVDIYSPLTPHGGMECVIKDSELGEVNGYNPHARQWMFNYTLDLVSTGDDEYDRGTNAIVSAITGEIDYDDDGEMSDWEGRRAVREA